MSPELMSNGGGKSFGSDMWALGMMIYEAGHTGLIVLSSCIESRPIDTERESSFQQSHSGRTNHARRPPSQKAPGFEAYTQRGGRIVHFNLGIGSGVLELRTRWTAVYGFPPSKS